MKYSNNKFSSLLTLLKLFVFGGGIFFSYSIAEEKLPLEYSGVSCALIVSLYLLINFDNYKKTIWLYLCFASLLFADKITDAYLRDLIGNNEYYGVEVASVMFFIFCANILFDIVKLTTNLIVRGVKFKSEKASNSSVFYNSKEWRNLRFKVFEKYGTNCECFIPGCTERATHVDHIKPRSKYPHLALDIDNMQLLCPDCNRTKSDKYEIDFRAIKDA